MVDYNMAKRTFTVLHQEDVVGLSNDAKGNFYVENFHSNFSGTHFHGDKHLHSPEDSQKLRDLSEAFSCERKEVISHDGVKIPLTILYSKSTKFSGQSPGVLHGYGAYGEVLDKSWSSDLLCLLNRGWVFAYADVRYDCLWLDQLKNPFKMDSIKLLCLLFKTCHHHTYHTVKSQDCATLPVYIISPAYFFVTLKFHLVVKL